MPGSPKKRARREAEERARNTTGAASKSVPQAAGQAAEPVVPAANLPSSAVTPLRGEVLPPEVATAEPTRTALKRAMRARAQEHAEAAIAVLVGSLASPDERVRLGAANDLLAWGFGKPAQEIEAGDGAQMIVIRKFVGEENQ